MKKELVFGLKEGFDKFEKLFGLSKPVREKRVSKKVKPLVKKRKPRAFKERLGFNPLESYKGQLAGTSSIVEKNLINPEFEKPQFEIEKVEPLAEIEKTEIKYKPKIQTKKAKVKSIVGKVKRKKPGVGKKVKARKTVKAKPLVKRAKPEIKHLRKAAAPELLKKKGGKIRIKRKIKALKLVSERIPELKIKAAPEVLPKALESLASLPCIQRKYVSSSEAYWCCSRRARLHGLLGGRKETLGKCSGCHMREPPK